MSQEWLSARRPRQYTRERANQPRGPKRAQIMSGPPPATIELSTRQRALLEQLRQRQTAPQRLVRRVLILLALADDPCLEATARDLGLNRISVRLWRDRWLDAAAALARAEKDNALRPAVPRPDRGDPRRRPSPRRARPPSAPSRSSRSSRWPASRPRSRDARSATGPIASWPTRSRSDRSSRTSPRERVGRFLKTGRAAAPSQPLLAQCRPA